MLRMFVELTSRVAVSIFSIVLLYINMVQQWLRT